MTEQFDERELRKAYVRRRQTIVFSVVATVMAVAVIVSSLFMFHVFGLGEQDSPVVKPNYGIQAPCAPADQDGNPAKYVDNSSVSIRVMNGTAFSGFAKAVGEALANRSFNVTSVGNYSTTSVERTTIYFGKNAIAEAYTLNSNFTDAILQMDDREDKLIDVVLGATFKDLQDKQNVPAAGANITNIEGCVAADQMTNVPKAAEHTAV
ncbi:LytR C-terminal domain-containing protein [Bifidobacterium tsurumiense]|uniref:LytR/CpsA/Psr regulator C-terminal domain-containing protein n=1 Tax=Bifidobacterium tsurumiense TaxID=356829 RepID=A0A087ED73_9BIFI|nr:LytR C-terminal domain-containing protein [Bifidobacterium tsurumiense]KFJ05724.1 hypothetical protein BITS_1818 [Bifidobacterium tsurumiense]MDY4678262.1 LytR C-terminal domain-containing protein [Bifidobacterium tsurumiense]